LLSGRWPLQILGLVLAAAAFGVRADMLIGPSGERLPGRFVEDKEGMVVFDSDFLGRLRVPSDRVRIERDAALPDTAAVPDSPPAVVSEPTASESESPPRVVRWSSDLAIKVGQDRGSLKTLEDTLDGTWHLSRQTDDGETSGTISYKYKSTDHVLKDDDWLGSIRYDKFLDDDHFVNARLLGVTELQSSGYDSTATLSMAYGWRFWDEQQKYVRIGPALGVLWLKRSGQTFDGAAVGFYARGVYPLWLGALVDEELQYLNAAAGSRYALSQLRLKRPINEHLYLAVDWLYSWTHVEIESGVRSEWRWVLGWTFDPQR